MQAPIWIFGAGASQLRVSLMTADQCRTNGRRAWLGYLIYAQFAGPTLLLQLTSIPMLTGNPLTEQVLATTLRNLAAMTPIAYHPRCRPTVNVFVIRLIHLAACSPTPLSHRG